MNFKQVFLFALASITLSVLSAIAFEFLAKPYLLEKKEKREEEKLSA